MEKHFGKIIFTIILLTFIILWLTINIKTSLYFISFFSAMMYINITVTTLCNALVGRELPPANGVFWCMVFIILAVIPFSIVLTI